MTSAIRVALVGALLAGLLATPPPAVAAPTTIDETEPNNIAAQANPLPADGTIASSVTPDDDIVVDDDNGRRDVFVAHRESELPTGSPPVARPDAYETGQDVPFTQAAPGVLANDSDPDEDPLSAELISDVTTGTLELAEDGSFNYAPPAGWWGEATYTYRASDGDWDSDPATVTITVTPAPPVANPDAYEANRETPLVIDAPGVLDNDTAAPGLTLTAELVNGVGQGDLDLDPDGGFEYLPAPGFVGTDTFTYRAFDGHTYTDPVTVTITVTYTPPVANPDAYETSENTPLNVAAPGVLGNDTRVLPGMTVSLEYSVSHGTLTLNPDGSFQYVPDPGFYGTDTFTYFFYSGFPFPYDPATVTITVTRTSAPVAAPDDYETDQDVPLAVAAPGVLANDTDILGDGLAAVLVTDVTAGTLNLLPSGSFSYTPPAGWWGDATFTYRAADADLDSDPATVTIAVDRTLPEDVTFAAVAGEDRYGTSVEASKRAFPEGADTVVIATGADFPDALGGAALAGEYEGPILLVRPDELPSEVLAEIRRLDVDTAIVLGSRRAVSKSVEDALRDELGSAGVRRIGGPDRYATANLVGAEVARHMGEDFGGKAFVTTGLDFPDALAASPIAAADVMPVYLAGADGLSSQTRSAMNAAGIDEVFVLGGTRAVSAGVQSQLNSALGASNVTRIGGADRYATAATVAQWGVDNAGLVWDGLAMTTGEDFADALAGGPIQGMNGSVLLPTSEDALDNHIAAVLSANRDGIYTVCFLGGPNVLGPRIRNQVAQALQ